MGKTKLDFRKLELEPTSSTKELLKNLESAQTLLEATEQDAARPSGLKGVARQLVSPGLVEHKSGAVRLWAATCLCEVLRVYAPRAPYGDDELLGVFGLLAASLRRHGQAGDGGRDAELTQDRVKRGRGVPPAEARAFRARTRLSRRPVRARATFEEREEPCAAARARLSRSAKNPPKL